VLISLLEDLELIGGEPLMSVTHGQCDARPTVTFSAARHHRPLAGTKLYCLVTQARVLTTCPGFVVFTAPKVNVTLGAGKTNYSANNITLLPCYMNN